MQEPKAPLIRWPSFYLDSVLNSGAGHLQTAALGPLTCPGTQDGCYFVLTHRSGHYHRVVVGTLMASNNLASR